MAGDWLKIEVITPDKPEIFDMAEALSITSDDVFGKCFRVWAWFDAHTVDGKCNGVIVTKMLVDRCAGITGFANAMLKVKWLLDGEQGLTIPNFDRHNGETAKQRALSAKRVAKARAKSYEECNGDSVTLSQPEKRREEKRINTTKSKAIALATRLPKDWNPSESDIEFCKTNRPDLNVISVAEEFRDYWAGVPGAKGKKEDWPATWRNWVRRQSAKPMTKHSQSKMSLQGIDYTEGVNPDGSF